MEMLLQPLEMLLQPLQRRDVKETNPVSIGFWGGCFFGLDAQMCHPWAQCMFAGLWALHGLSQDACVTCILQWWGAVGRCGHSYIAKICLVSNG